MILNTTKWIQDQISQQLKVSHLEKKVDCKVVSKDNLNKSILQKIKEDKGEDFVDKIDILMGFVIDQGNGGDVSAVDDETEKEDVEDKEQDVEDNNDGEEKEEGEEDKEETEEQSDETSSSSSSSTSEETEDKKEDDKEKEDKEDSSDNETDKEEEDSDSSDDEKEEDEKEDEDDDDDNKKKNEDKEESLNENVKIQDLTKSMLTPIKALKEDEGCNCDKKKKKKKKCCRGTRFLIPAGPIPTPKPPQPGPEPGPQPGPEPGPAPDMGGPMEEAETEATGLELLGKLQKALSKLFKGCEDDNNKLELLQVRDVPGAYYAILSIQNAEQPTA